MKRTEVAKIVAGSELWIADVDGVRYCYTRYWAAPMPEDVARLLDYWNLPPTPGSFMFKGRRAMPWAEKAPDLARLLSPPVREPTASALMKWNETVTVTAARGEVFAVLNNGNEDIAVRVDFLRLIGGPLWYQRPMACERPNKPLWLWLDEQPAIIMPVSMFDR